MRTAGKENQFLDLSLYPIETTDTQEKEKWANFSIRPHDGLFLSLSGKCPELQ